MSNMRPREAFPWKNVSTSLRLCFANFIFKATSAKVHKHYASYALPGNTRAWSIICTTWQYRGACSPSSNWSGSTCTVQSSRWAAAAGDVQHCLTCILPSQFPSVSFITVICEGSKMRSAQLCLSLAEERAEGEQSSLCCPPQYGPCVCGTSRSKTCGLGHFQMLRNADCKLEAENTMGYIHPDCC